MDPGKKSLFGVIQKIGEKIKMDNELKTI